MGIQCPKCDSDNVQAVKAILEGGTTRSTGNYSGYVAGGSSSGNVGGGYSSGTTFNTSKTDLARSLESFIFGGKPEGVKYGWSILAIAILILVFISFLLGAIHYFNYWIDGIGNPRHQLTWGMESIFSGLIPLALAIPFFRRISKKKKEHYEELSKWKKSSSDRYGSYFYCHKCGDKFTP